MQELLQRGYPNIVKPTWVLFRRFYAAYAYKYFKDDFNDAMSVDAFTSFVLGHAVLSDTVISYNSLKLQNAGKLKLFEVGKASKVAGK